MKIPETPPSVPKLDLMKRLQAYAEGKATWYRDETPLGENAKKASQALHTRIVEMVEKVLAPIMDRTTARELDTFTMHDQKHGRKVAHLMWHILSSERQLTLTPPEIGLLVLAAHLHDAGMALSQEERAKRLAPESDLWDRAEANPTIKRNLKRLRDMLTDSKLADSKRVRVESELLQAEEALLALDTRERHALRERYEEIVTQLSSFHVKDPTKIPDVEECLSFDGDSLRKKLIDICVSHNDDADALVERDPEKFDRPRFPRDYPVGLANADTHMAAAALRLADILDFDRERTPPTLFLYLVPSSLSHSVNISELEWGKHLSISNWEIDQSAVVFRGRCKNHIVHHAVVQFCKAIEEEITSTRATFAIGDTQSWPFILPETVKADIHEDGSYHYVPYQFELDDSRVYELLMGRAIYNNSLVAVRELIQNAVDACTYRDALSKLTEPHFQPDTLSRIAVRYEEPERDKEYPVLRVIDTGTGMDEWLIERWFLKVGRSFYSSTEFARDRAQLRRGGVDFAPVSEFGIGFLSCFLLADRVDVETAMWEPIRGDTRRRHLEIDGPTRLIRIRENANIGLQRLRGTKVSLTLVRGGRVTPEYGPVPPTWQQVRDYVHDLCQDIPYRLNLEYVKDGEIGQEHVDPRPLRVALPSPFDSRAYRIVVAQERLGLEGEIAIVPYAAVREADRERRKSSAIQVPNDASEEGQAPSSTFRRMRQSSTLIRGGFKVGRVPGSPVGNLGVVVGSRIRISWKGAELERYPITNLARTAIADQELIASGITEAWMTNLIENRALLPAGFLFGLALDRGTKFSDLRWLERCSALAVYELARNTWNWWLLDSKNNKKSDPILDWEQGQGRAAIPSYDLCWHMLQLVLPRVAADRVLTAHGDIYVMPPIRGWRNTLGACNDFVSAPVRWRRVATFEGSIADHLYHEWGGHRLFNRKYADRLKDFSEEDLRAAGGVLSALISDCNHGRPTELDAEKAALLRRLGDTARDLEISSVSGTLRLATLLPRRK